MSAVLRRPTLAVVLGVVLTGLVLSPSQADVTDPPAADLTITAHRGAPGHGVGENTLEAFKKAVAAGATAVETDVRRTKDDQLVLLHDPGLGRTTNCTGPIASWTLARLDARCSEKFSHKPLPHFADALAWLARHDGVAMMVEPKGKSWSPVQLARLVRTIKDSGVKERVVVSSLRVDHLKRIHRLAPNLGTQLIVPGWSTVKATLGAVSGYNVPVEFLTRGRVKRLHKRGLRVVGGHSDAPDDWRRLAKLGVDGVVVPNVRRYRWYIH